MHATNVLNMRILFLAIGGGERRRENRCACVIEGRGEGGEREGPAHKAGQGGQRSYFACVFDGEVPSCCCSPHRTALSELANA